MSTGNPLLNPKPLPKKLEEDLSNVNRVYRNNSQGRISTSVDAENIIPTLGSKKPSSIAHIFDDSAERAMYDEILGPMLKPKRLPAGSGYEATRLATSANRANQQNSSGTSSISPSTDFTTTILQRLRIVEAEAKDSRQQLAVQLTRNQQLEDEVTSLKAATDDSKDMIADMKKLKQENYSLKKKIQDMEDFLADYGLVWVGNDKKEQQKAANPSRGRRLNEDDDDDNINEDDGEQGHIVSFAEFSRFIKELNDIIFAEPTQIVKDDREKKARLAHASEVLERIRVIYYKNGLMIKRGPFRPCNSNSYLSFVQDVIDGYFPSEFRKEYPDGVTFDLVDKHDVEFVEGVTDQSQELRMSTTQFLNRLAKKTILKNGEIVEIRGDIEARLNLQSGYTGNANGSGSSAAPVPDTTTKTNEEERPKTSGGSGFCWEPSTIPDPNAGNYGKIIHIDTEASKNPHQIKLGKTAKIQVKWIDHTSLVMVMFELNTIQELREEIARHFKQQGGTVPRTSCQDVELRTSFPAKLLLDGVTLMEASLVPNGTIHARKI